MYLEDRLLLIAPFNFNLVSAKQQFQAAVSEAIRTL